MNESKTGCATCGTTVSYFGTKFSNLSAQYWTNKFLVECSSHSNTIWPVPIIPSLSYAKIIICFTLDCERQNLFLVVVKFATSKCYFEILIWTWIPYPCHINSNYPVQRIFSFSSEPFWIFLCHFETCLFLYICQCMWYPLCSLFFFLNR